MRVERVLRVVNGPELLDQRVRLVTGQGTAAFDALVVSYTDAPTYGVVLGNGLPSSWRADLVGRVLTCQACRAFHDVLRDLGEDAREVIAARWSAHRETCPDGVVS